MRQVIFIIIVLSVWLSSCTAENANEENIFYIQTDHAHEVIKGTVIKNLGVEVGRVEAINISNNKVILTIELTQPVLTASSFISVSYINNGKYEMAIDNSQSASFEPLNAGDTLHTIFSDGYLKQEIQVTIPEQKFDRIDSLKLKINNLKNLMKEIHGEN